MRQAGYRSAGDARRVVRILTRSGKAVSTSLEHVRSIASLYLVYLAVVKLLVSAGVKTGVDGPYWAYVAVAFFIAGILQPQENQRWGRLLAVVVVMELLDILVRMDNLPVALMGKFF